MIEIEDMNNAANEAYAWVNAYIEAGFTRDEAVAVYVAWQSRSFIQQPQTTPELAELMAKTRLIADATIQHINEAEDE